MKLNTLTSLTHSFRRPAVKVAVAGCFAFAVQVACSDAPQNGTPTFPSTAGTPGTAGAPSTAGAPAGTAGTFATTAGTAGTFGTAGTGFETGGTAGAATGGGGAGGVGTAGAATAGTGGVIVPPAPFCMNHAVAPLPYKVNDNYYPSGWSEGGPTAQISTPTTNLVTDYCLAASRPTGAVGDCTKWRYTPAAAGGTAVWVIWEVPAAAPLNHVCLPEGVSSIAFCARGEVGGEKIMTGGSGVPEAMITLTNAWKTFTVPLTGVTYNTVDKGVPTGFVWKIDPATTGAPALTEFFIDKIQFVKDAPAADYCGGGSSGEGGAGGAN